MAYYINLSEISLDKHKETLLNNYLIPSWRVLRDDIDMNFLLLQEIGISNLQELKNLLKTKKNVLQLSMKTNIDKNYIIVLRREINSHHPPERKIIEYPTISDETKDKLISMGLKTSKDVYEYLVEINNVETLRNNLNESEDNIIHIARLIDVTRLRYVSPLFATVLALSTCNTVEKLKEADEKDLYNQISEINKKNEFYKGKIGVNDMKFLIQDAQDVETDILFM